MTFRKILVRIFNVNHSERSVLIRLIFKQRALFRNNFSKLEANEGNVEHKYLVECSGILQDSSEPSHAEQGYFIWAISSCRTGQSLATTVKTNTTLEHHTFVYYFLLHVSVMYIDQHQVEKLHLWPKYEVKYKRRTCRICVLPLCGLYLLVNYSFVFNFRVCL